MRLLAFLQGWDLLRDELRRSPTLEEYAGRFGLSPDEAARDWELSERAFAGVPPDQVLDTLWSWHESRRRGDRPRSGVELKPHSEMPIPMA